MLKEMPGAITPWSQMNRLLGPDERFACDGQQFLLAPKQVSSLAATLYLCHELGIQPLISTRALKWMKLLDNSVELGAGCKIGEVEQFLFEQGMECQLTELLPLNRKTSVGEAIKKGFTSGLLGLEFLKKDGGIVRLGSSLAAAATGPIVNINNLELVTCAYFLSAPKPAERISLTWSDQQPDILLALAKQLQQFATTWERLDLVLSGHEGEKSFLLAQISGSSEEMAAFRAHCPALLLARQQNDVDKLKNYLSQHQFTPLIECKTVSHSYCWWHCIQQAGWLFNPSSG